MAPIDRERFQPLQEKHTPSMDSTWLSNKINKSRTIPQQISLITDRINHL